MADTDWGAFTDVATLTDSDILLALRGAGGVNIPGSALLKKDASGNVGIGTTTPKSRIHASGAANGYAPSLSSADGVAFISGLDPNYGLSAGPRGSGSFWLQAGRSDGTAIGYTLELNPLGGAVAAGGILYPVTDNLHSLGFGGSRWSQLHAATSVIATSDERAKQDIAAIPDEWLDAWGAVEWVRYKFKDAVEAKGSAARWHVGLIAQRVRDTFAERGLDAEAIGLLCYDEWDEQTETGDGGETRVTLEAGDRWGLRYDECQAMEAAWQRRELARKDALIADLANRLAALEAA